MVRATIPTNNGASSSSSRGLCRGISYLDSRSLIPGLPNDLACVCLAYIPLWEHRRLKAVSRGWKVALSGEFIIELRQKLGKTEEFLCLFRDDPSICRSELFDPRAEIWSTLPPMPCNPSKYSLSNYECVASGACLYVLGGSLYDTRVYPMDHPVASNSVFKLDLVKTEWEQCADMKTSRGSFACGVHEGCVFVAGGGSRHAQFRAGGDRLCEAEKYDMQRNSWESLPVLTNIRAGCTGFFVDDEFWVIGGYGESGTISGILPVDEHYNDGEVFNAKTGNWRSLEPMWEDGTRLRLGRVAVLHDVKSAFPKVFMLENSYLLRYDFICNRWYLESELPITVAGDQSCRLVCVDGEVYVIPGGVTDHHQRARSPRPFNKNERRRGNILFQIYHPAKQTWRTVFTKPPLDHSTNPPWGAMCVIKL